MLSFFKHYTCQDNPTLVQMCGTFCRILIIAVLILMFTTVFFVIKLPQQVYVILIDPQARVSTLLNENFLSIALDSVVIANGFKNFNMTDPKLIKLMQHLSPAYLRIGGTMADRLVFTSDPTFVFKYIKDSDEKNFYNFTMSGQEWLALNTLAKNSNLKIIFNLNALRRFEGNSSWDYRNAENLIEFSQLHNLTEINWELGNEPNSFKHKFNYKVIPEQLSKDFYELRQILNKYRNYRNCLLVGPDVTRPKIDHKESQIYLKRFLNSGGGESLDALTWHQYYFDGRTAHYNDFIDPLVLDMLKWQIFVIKEIAKYGKFIQKPIWLGETSSAYGGGAPGYSNRYIASFIWLDKLGISAEYGLDLIIRQSIFNGYYALIDDNYNPTPDWWVSVLYKTLVGRRVLPCYKTDSNEVRLYCHCNNTSVTIFGMNLFKSKIRVRIEGLGKEVFSYLLTTNYSLYSKNIFLNDQLLKLTDYGNLPNFEPKIMPVFPFVEIPPFSMVFWVAPTEKISCDI